MNEQLQRRGVDRRNYRDYVKWVLEMGSPINSEEGRKDMRFDGKGRKPKGIVEGDTYTD